MNSFAAHILAIFLFFSGIASAQTSQLWGSAKYGGTADLGIIYNTNGDGTGFTVDYSFPNPYSGYNSSTQIGLTDGKNGKFYGLTTHGGENSKGVLYSYDTSSGVYVELYHFGASSTSPASPVCEMIRAANGKLYGVTRVGGNYNNGTLFEYNIGQNSLSVKIHFSSSVNGRLPATAPIQASNGKLYGVTSEGGVDNEGILYEYTISANTLQVRHDFVDSTGIFPVSGLFEASDGKLYGTTKYGGTTWQGTLYSYNIVSGTVEKRADFNTSNGVTVSGNLMEADGFVLGITTGGGPNSKGVVYKYNLAQDSFSFLIEQTNSHGTGQFSSAPDGSVWLMFGIGIGSGYGGLLLRIDSSDLSIDTLHTFSYTLQNLYNPTGCMLFANNKMYFLSKGGDYGYGAINVYDPSIDSVRNLFYLGRKLSGYYPYSPLLKADDDMLYGVASGGLYDKGVLYRYDPVNAELTVVHHFDRMMSEPASMPIQADNGVLYGLAWHSYDSGTSTTEFGGIYEYNPGTDSFKVIHFSTDPQNSNPEGYLLQAANGKLYGVINSGSSLSADVLFEYDISSSTYTKKIVLTNHSIQDPVNGLMQAPNGKLYGTSTKGGSYNGGVIYEYNISTNAVSIVYHFNPSNTSRPGGVPFYLNGKLYGTTTYGGSYFRGVLYSYELSSGTFTILEDLIPNTGFVGAGSLIRALNGKLYGINADGGNYGDGTLFEYDLGTGNITRKYAFNSSTGGPPSSGPLAEIVICVENGSVLTDTVCEQFLSPSGKYLITSSGEYFDTLQNNCGYDSIIQLKITVLGQSVSFDTIMICKGSSFVFANGDSSSNIQDSLTYMSVLGSAGWACDSFVFQTLLLAPEYELFDTFEVPRGNDFTFHDDSTVTNVLFAMNYLSRLTSHMGCDSIINTRLNICKADSFYFNASICAGDSFVFPDKSVAYNISGPVRQVSVLDAKTSVCDSVVITRLDPVNGQEIYDTALVCTGDPLVLPNDSVVYPESNQQFNILLKKMGSGCDSIVHLYVELKKISDSIYIQNDSLISVHEGSGFQWLDCDSEFLLIEGATGRQFQPLNSGNYAVEISDHFCKDTSFCLYFTAKSDTTSGISELSLGLQVYPVPTNGPLALIYHGNLNPAQFSILSSQGQVLYSDQIWPELVKDVRLSLAPGLYYLSLSDPNYRGYIKLVVL